MQARGRFITFEGIDGSGKTTQMRRLAERLRRQGRTVLETVEPGGTAVGAQIRRILLDSRNTELRPIAELLLYFASRAQNIEQCILPALSAGTIVLCDRFTDSTLAYQGYARGLGEAAVLTLDRIACRGLQPDLTILIDVDLETGLARARARNLDAEDAETRMDDQALEFHRKVRDAYLKIAAQNAGRFRVVDGRGSPEAVAEKVWEHVAPYV
ncbi:MAG TPA: dTMP kinase [Bryobacteraceae bacterium]|nr:dTMP kinase [Bryobacteraceae bacterium]HUJ20004.1 dTMP kinase [Bryobacteraceae bacterium]